jgi:hypothetical protein
MIAASLALWLMQPTPQVIPPAPAAAAEVIVGARTVIASHARELIAGDCAAAASRIRMEHETPEPAPR